MPNENEIHGHRASNANEKSGDDDNLKSRMGLRYFPALQPFDQDRMVPSGI